MVGRNIKQKRAFLLRNALFVHPQGFEPWTH